MFILLISAIIIFFLIILKIFYINGTMNKNKHDMKGKFIIVTEKFFE